MTFTASGIFYLSLRDILQNDTAIDLIADSIKFALYTNTLTTPNFDTNTAYGAAPWNANEVTGTGYTAGGVAIANDTITVAAGSLLTYDGDDLTWSSATISAIRGAMGYDDTIATPVAKPGILGITFGADYSVTAGLLTVQFAAGGVMTVDLP